jgi:soluble lytic murein transglycosylase-like protein
MNEEPLKKAAFRVLNKWKVAFAPLFCLILLSPCKTYDTLPPVFRTRIVNSAPAIKLPPSVEKAKGQFNPIILQAASRYEVDASLIKAVIMAESRYNPKAVSKRGAIGLMQLMPQTAKALGVKNAFNPEHNINGGVKYLKKLLDQFGGDVRLAVAAYNAGSKRVKEYKGVPPFKATRFYLKKVFDYYRYFRHHHSREANKA